MKYGEYVDAKLKTIDDQLTEIDQIAPADDLHLAEITQAKEKLIEKENEFWEAKQSIEKQEKAKATFEDAKKEAIESVKNKKEAIAEKKQFLDSQRAKYPDCFNEETKQFDLSKWSQEEKKNLQVLHDKSAKAVLDAAEKVKAADEAKDKLAKKDEKLKAIKAKIIANVPSDKNLDTACVPCELKKRNEKIAKLKAVFPGQQQYGNCGIQSSSQVIELVTGVKKGEAELLKEALQNQEAVLTRAKKNPVSTLISKILGKYPTEDELIAQISDTPPADLGEKINRNATGGTWAETRETLLARHNVPTTPVVYSRDELAKALKANKAVIPAVDASLLSPGFDRDGNAMATWPANQPPGSHAVVVGDGIFNDKGEITHVLINDTGVGKQYYMDINSFEKAVDGNKKLNKGADVPMNVTNNPII